MEKRSTVNAVIIPAALGNRRASMKRVVLSLCVLVLFAVPASAQVTYMGNLSWDECLNANNNWADTDTIISWTVSQAVMGGPWTYEYTLTVADDPEISHFILELTPGLTEDNFISIDWPDDDIEINTFDSAGPGASNPGLPCPIYGIKFDDVEALSETFSFTTNIAPVWGDFYAKGGVTTRVFNDTICEADPLNPPANGSINCKLLRPDFQNGIIIPEPASMALAMLGVLPLVGYKLRRRQ